MNIAMIRKRLGLTQIELAERAKLTQPTVSRAERGDDGTTMATLQGIAAALNVPLEALFVEDRSPIETELITIFRTLPPDRQKDWVDLARAIAGRHP